MKIAGVTLCFNESKMIKYVMPYWERVGIDKLIVYDNMSTDNTVELLKQYPFVEVRSFDTGGKFNDRKHIQLKVAAYYELRNEGYDWVYLGDFDEVIWCPNPNFRDELKKIEDLGGTSLCRDLVHPFSPVPYNFDSSKLIHEQLPMFLTWHDLKIHWAGSKVILHKTSAMPKLNYDCGQHIMSMYKECNPVFFGYPFISFHLKYVDLDVLSKNSIEKNDRISYRFSALTKENHRKHLMDWYGNTCGDEKTMKTLQKMVDKTYKVDTDSWEKFLDRYNTYEFLVNRTKNTKPIKVPRLDYDNIDMNIFYKEDL